MFLKKKMTFNSLNEQTGLLEDIKEVREQGLFLADLIFSIMAHPAVKMFFPRGARLDMLTFASQTASFLTPTSQADMLRLLGMAAGIDPLEIEFKIMHYGLSEMLPATHPDAPNPPTEPIDTNDPLVRGSYILGKMAELQAKEAAQTNQLTESPNNLSKEIERLLRELEGKSSTDETRGGE